MSEFIKLNRLLYSKWNSMKFRVTDNKKYRHRYFDRGIGICEEWKNSFESFAYWALSNGYQSHLQLDRKDNDKGYSPENCHFVTHLENTRNRDNANMRQAIRKVKSRQMAKPFICHQTKQIFLTEISASRIMGLERRNIGRVLKRVYKQVKGFTFSYIMIPLAMYETLLNQEDGIQASA